MTIILSIKPQFTNLILDGRKTIEMRTKIGKKFIKGAKIIIYSSSPVKAIVAIAKIKEIEHLHKRQVDQKHLKKVCISQDFFDQYMKTRSECYLIELIDIKKIIKPISLVELKKNNFTAPQSFCYASNEIEQLVRDSK